MDSVRVEAVKWDRKLVFAGATWMVSGACKEPVLEGSKASGAWLVCEIAFFLRRRLSIIIAPMMSAKAPINC
jgi:hypothetical protein